MRSQNHHEESGFSLIEVMVAMVIFLVASVSLAQLLAMTTRMQLQAQNTTETTRFAETKLDELRTLDFATDPSIQLTTPAVLDTDVTNSFDTPASGVTRRWSVVAGPTATTRSVTVRVIDKAGSLGARTVDLTTVLRQW
jgi:prepilin-type N-terminal cleavage/methylation domain-containing protein